MSNELYEEFDVNIKAWYHLNYSTYLKLKSEANLKDFKRKLNDFLRDKRFTNGRFKLEIQPLRRIYLHSNFTHDLFAETGNLNFVYILIIVGIFILVIACFNFMNLATARCENRMMEVGVRKAVGARFGQLVRQYLGETMITKVTKIDVLNLSGQIVAGIFSNTIIGNTLENLLSRCRSRPIPIGNY